MVLCRQTSVLVCSVNLLDTHFRLRAAHRCLVLKGSRLETLCKGPFLLTFVFLLQMRLSSTCLAVFTLCDYSHGLDPVLYKIIKSKPNTGETLND